MKTTYTMSGTCAKAIEVEVDKEGHVLSVSFIGGCDGNLQGISRLVSGMSIDEVITRLSGIKCGRRSTSCPDQLAIALSEIKRNISDKG